VWLLSETTFSQQELHVGHELQNWLDEITAKPVDFFKHGIENLPERWRQL
jgi:hypothetical protein